MSASNAYSNKNFFIKLLFCVCVCVRVYACMCAPMHTHKQLHQVMAKNIFLIADCGHKGLENTAPEHKFFDHGDVKLSLAHHRHSVCESKDPYFIDEETNS